MTKSRHKDTGAGTGTGADPGTGTGTDPGTGAGGGAGAGAATVPLVLSSRAESRLERSAFLSLSSALGGAAGAAEVSRCEAQMFRFQPGEAAV